MISFPACPSPRIPVRDADLKGSPPSRAAGAARPEQNTATAPTAPVQWPAGSGHPAIRIMDWTLRHGYAADCMLLLGCCSRPAVFLAFVPSRSIQCCCCGRRASCVLRCRCRRSAVCPSCVFCVSCLLHAPISPFPHPTPAILHWWPSMLHASGRKAAEVGCPVNARK